MNAVVLANREEAGLVAESADPTDAWDGLEARSFTVATLSALTSIVTTGSVGAGAEAVLLNDAAAEAGSIRALPDELIDALAGLTERGDERAIELIAARWRRTDGMDHWSDGQLAAVVREFGRLAREATLTGRTLLLVERGD